MLTPYTTVAKSYIPGQGFVSAAKAGKNALKAVPKGRYVPRKQVHPEPVNAEMSTARAEALKYVRSRPHDETKVHGRSINTYYPHKVKEAAELGVGSGKDGPARGGFTLLHGGKRGSAVVVVHPHAPKFIGAHETAHAAPKRSSYRLAQITADPKKLGREEARADMAAGQYWRKLPADGHIGSGYALNAATDRLTRAKDPFGHTYRKTQDRIALSRGQIGKSLVGGKFVPAVQAGKAALKAVPKGRYASAGLSEADRGFVAAAPRRAWSASANGTKQKLPGGRTVVVHSEKLPRSVDGITDTYGGKKGTASITLSSRLKSRGRSETVAHEMAHATPQRSSYRMSQIGRDPAKRAREEARAERAEHVIKMGPDASEVHVMGAGLSKKRKAKLVRYTTTKA